MTWVANTIFGICALVAPAVIIASLVKAAPRIVAMFQDNE